MLFGILATMALAALSIAQDGNWVTVKGQVILPEAEAKKALESAKVPVNVTADQKHCNSKGPLLPTDVIVNPKNGGLKNVVVFLRPANKDRDPKFLPKDIHPDFAKRTPKALVIDQPCCQFEPRITVGTSGDTLTIKNSSPVNHNSNYSSDRNGSENPNIPPAGEYKFKNPLLAERLPIPLACNIHPWMKAQIYVFDHPYFAVTDEDGKFEIKNAPKGAFSIVYRHEGGFHKGAEGRFGTPIDIKAGNNNTMELKPMQFEFPKN
jgi:hypothetical protein